VKKNEQKKEEIKRAIKRVKMGEKAWATTDKPKDLKKDLPTIKILSTRKVKMVELDVDIPDKVKAGLLKMARVGILKDEKALLSWAFVKGIEYGVEFCTKAKK
jgi:hypothetical protein